MLKTHLQPIVAYFFNSSGSSTVKVAQPKVQGSHLQPTIDQFLTPDRRENRSSAQPSKARTFLGWLWRSLIQVNTDPRIQQRFDRSGQPYWQAYDPIMAQYHRFFSEEEVYQWLERRYYE